MAYMVTVSIYLAAFLLLCTLTRPLLRRFGISHVLYGSGGLILILFYTFLRHELSDLLSARYYIPWPAPQALSSVAALDYAYGTDWYTLLQYIWYAGMGAFAVGLIVHTLLFRRRIRQSSTPAPDRIAEAAAQIFKEMKRTELTEELKSDADRKPTEEELADCEKIKLPRLLVSSAVDGPIYCAWRKTLVLPDNAAYTDRQLDFILRHAFCLSQNGYIKDSGLHIIAMCTGWFNPLFCVLRRMEAPDAAMTRDTKLADSYSPEEKEEYLATLHSLSNPQRPSIHYCLIAGPESEAELRAEHLRIKKPHKTILIIASSILTVLFFFGMFCLIQPPNVYPVNEESIFSILGEDPEKLYGDRYSIDLRSTEEDGLLFGTPYFKAYSAPNDQRISFHYPTNAAPELLEASAQRVFGALTQRLGPPDGQHDSDASPEVNGALIDKIEQQLSLLLASAGYTPPEEVETSENTPASYRYIWSVKTKEGQSARIILRIQPDGAYWTDETDGGLLIEIELQ